MVKAKDLRKQAWSALSGHWGTMALCWFIASLILGVCAGLSWIGIGAVVMLLITGPLTLGMSILALNVIRGKSVKVETLFDGFKNFVSAFLLALTNSILIALWSILLIIPGIIKTYSYSMGMYVLADNPSIGFNDARKQSMAMMKGNKWRLFCLDLSFIGWFLLCIITFGILSFWVSPYHESARVAFYQDLLARNGVAAQPVDVQPVAEIPAENVVDVQPEAPAEEVSENGTDAE